MDPSSQRTVFFTCFLLALLFALCTSAFGHFFAGEKIATLRLAEHVSVAEQLQPANLSYLKRQGVSAIVDLRPDGEAAGQPSSQQMEQAARAAGMRFAYIPVPHGAIPQDAVDRLAANLSGSSGAIVLYCRSGRRAARTWALAEASRPGGPDAETILAAVRGAGQSAQDLSGDIQARVATRAPKGARP